MSTKHPIQIRYRFERLGGAVRSEFEHAAEVACHLVETMPWAVYRLPFGSASCVSGGLLETIPSAPRFSQRGVDSEERVGLKAVESPDGVLLENSYDAHGCLHETTYPDGVTVRYSWNDGGQLTTVWQDGGNAVDYDYRGDGLLDTVTYPGRTRFHYEYDDAGKLLRRVYPDGKTARYSYDKQGQPVEVAFANCRFAYDWDNRRSLRRVVFECENEVQELRLDKDRLDINLVPNGEDSAGQFDFVSALGLWACSAEGALSEMILPDGERLFTRSPSVTGGVAFWDSSGEMTCHSDKQGVLSNVLFPNGLRAAWRRSSEKGRVYLVGPGGVALNQYSREGKLLKTRWAEGQYTVFSYDRRGEVKKVATSCGWVKLRHDAAGRLQRAHFSSGLSAELSHGTATYPTAISLRNTAMDSLSAALVSMRTIWEWTVARPSLRLEDSALREV